MVEPFVEVKVLEETNEPEKTGKHLSIKID
jgi:hypothetical protein